MGHSELLATVTELRSLRNMAAELQDEINALEDIVKAEMNAQGVDKLFVGDCKVTWTEYNTNRFDTKTFKAEHEELYKKYSKNTKARKFIVS